MLITTLALLGILGGDAAPPGAPSPPPKPLTRISTGAEADLAEKRLPEVPNVFLFYKPASTLERAFMEELRRSVNPAVAMGVIELKTGEEPITRQYSITETPTAIVYDRRGRVVKRSSQADEIRAAVEKAGQVMRIDWPDESDPRYAETQRLLGRPVKGGILRTMTMQPEYLDYIDKLSRKAHFTDGFLNRRTKEMIATYVSALNGCKY